ncbi:MAG: hypothetical protein ABL908_16460, partial [Hyphomicrobium sp.]
MLSDDVYKTRLRETTAAIELWLSDLRPVAAIETARDEASWRVSVHPNVPDACPFELVLRADQQFDIAIGPETYEDLPVGSLDQMLPLLRAIADGGVITRYWTTAATGTLAKVETIVGAAASAWRQERVIAPLRRIDAGDLIARDCCYAPYARG